jgi:hypothetical protein
VDDVTSTNDIRYGRSLGNSNVAFSAWGAFIISLLLLSSWWKASVTSTDWMLLSAFSFALMVSSFSDYRATVDLPSDDGRYTETKLCTIVASYSCSRIILGQYLGMVSGIISLLMIPMTRVSIIYHIPVSVALLIAWAVGVSQIAYGSGHGRYAGNVFLEVWASLFLSLDVAATNIAVLVRIRERVKSSNTEMAESTDGAKIDTYLALDGLEQAVDEADTEDCSEKIPEIAEAVTSVMSM